MFERLTSLHTSACLSHPVAPTFIHSITVLCSPIFSPFTFSCRPITRFLFFPTRSAHSLFYLFFYHFPPATLFPFAFHQPILNPTPLLGCFAGRGSWCLSSRLLGCHRGLQRSWQDLRTLYHHRAQTEPRRQRGLLEDLPPLLRLPRLPHEDHGAGDLNYWRQK